MDTHGCLRNKVILGDCFDIFKNISDGSIDAIVTDPPYKYLNHALETNWNEKLFFSECFRVLKENSYLVFFGKGRSFFRWCVIAEEAGFIFKEDIIWDKIRISTPLIPISRQHEQIAIFAKGKPKFNEVRVDSIEYDLLGNPRNIAKDISRVITGIKSIKSYDELVEFRAGKLLTGGTQKKTGVTVRTNLKYYQGGGKTFKKLDQGRKISSIYRLSLNNRNRNHPTEKPTLLLQDLIKLISRENDIILDPFCGSGSTAIASKDCGRNYICIEKMVEYHQVACDRINQWSNQLSLL